MEIGLREWLIVIGIIVIAGILFRWLASHARRQGKN